ncbi:MAG: ribonuclease III [Clostridia bacterium]|jgi:ribonuclease III family protein|nr:ribonuclease III [Clostridia bacterium]
METHDINAVVSDNKIREFSALNLAYIGDTVYDLYVRTHIVKKQMGKVQALHKLASGVVNAKAQAAAATLVLPQLSEREREIFGYGKNTKSRPPKNMSFQDYSMATAIEAVIGYLYLTGQTARMDELMGIVIAHFLKGK